MWLQHIGLADEESRAEITPPCSFYDGEAQFPFCLHFHDYCIVLICSCFYTLQIDG